MLIKWVNEIWQLLGFDWVRYVRKIVIFIPNARIVYERPFIFYFVSVLLIHKF